MSGGKQMKAANEIIALCLMMAVGVYGRKKNYIDERVESGLNSILVNLIVPLAIINSFKMEYNPEIIDNCKKLIIASVPPPSITSSWYLISFSFAQAIISSTR